MVRTHVGTRAHTLNGAFEVRKNAKKAERGVERKRFCFEYLLELEHDRRLSIEQNLVGQRNQE